ncbi:MAG: ABC transporter permease [Candidatus Methanofastidiosia archaeon]
MLETFSHYARAVNAENVKEWRIELSYRVDFVRGMLEPLIYVLPFLLYGIAITGGRFSENLLKLTGTGDMITYTVIGYLFMGFLNTAVWGMGYALRKEQFYGTLESIFVAPVPRWVYVLGMAFHSTFHQSLIIGFQIILIYGIFGLYLKISGLLPSLLIVAVMMLALYGLGIMVSALTLIFKEGWIVSEILHSVITIVTPIAYPLAVLPTFLQKLSTAFPTTYGILGIRHYLMGEVIGFSIFEIFSRMILLAILWIGFGLFIFNIVDRKVRREGTLGEY